MRNGGYQVLDFKGYNFTSGQMVGPKGHKLHIYSQVEATNKRTIVSGLVIGGVEFDDMEVHFVSSQSNFVGTVYAGNGSIQITLASNDAITVTRTV